ncbi:MAG TPA: enoyl-CoA hydratase/isomerase family protein [Burkholderiaceae bacterium]
MTDSVVLFDEIKTAGGQRFAVATLNAPASLNALSVDMVRLLTPKLREWASDAGIVGVLLQAAGEKAFCAGGDLRQLYQTLLDCGPERNTYAEDFFREEYELDYLIHTFPKPFLCWGHGIVMGGGVGLLAGASHRVMTLQSRIAMPEINIGLYPDVGGSWFLGRMPGRCGLFLALTGAPLNAADACFAGLADHVLRHEEQGAVLEAIARERWDGAQAADSARLARLLASFETARPDSPLRAHLDRIDAVIGRDGLDALAPRLAALAHDADPWLAAAGAAFAKGSPTSARLAVELQRRARHLSLADVFRLEYRASVGCCVHADFAEGVRALLVDKDKSPRWQRATLAEVDDAFVDAHLAPRFEGAHPLADLP